MVHTQIRTQLKNTEIVNSVVAWCMKKIGPRLFYLHDKQGGIGWKIVRDRYSWYVELEDPRMMTLLILSIGDEL